jgi:hypothetical protein
MRVIRPGPAGVTLRGRPAHRRLERRGRNLIQARTAMATNSHGGDQPRFVP